MDGGVSARESVEVIDLSGGMTLGRGDLVGKECGVLSVRVLTPKGELP